jgi:hypothetical protein
MSQDSPYVLSVAQLEAVKSALDLFNLSLGDQLLFTYKQEEAILPGFEKVADALSSLRPALDAANGSGPPWWENELVPLLREIDTWFLEEVARAWGWLPYLTPSSRETTKEQRWERFRIEIERPLDEAAMVWVRDDPANCSQVIRDRARRGYKAGYKRAMTIEEAKSRLHRDSDWSGREVETPCYGRVYPELPLEQKKKLWRLLGNLTSALKPVVEESKADGGAPVARGEQKPKSPVELPALAALEIALELLPNKLAAKGYTLEAAFVRYFQSRQTATHQEIVEAICPGKERSWGTVKTWVNRVKNALIEIDPHSSLRFSTSQREYLVTKKLLRE